MEPSDGEKRKHFVYGTLRRGSYNYERFGLARRSRRLGPAVLEGARMYDVGGYPCVVLTGDPAETVAGEIVEFLDPACERVITRMEEYAGFVLRPCDVAGSTVWVFVMADVPRCAVPIRSGDWVSWEQGERVRDE